MIKINQENEIELNMERQKVEKLNDQIKGKFQKYTEYKLLTETLK